MAEMKPFAVSEKDSGKIEWAKGEGYLDPLPTHSGHAGDYVDYSYQHGLGYGKATVTTEGSIDPNKGEVKVSLIKGEAKGSVYHGKGRGSVDLGQMIIDGFDWLKEKLFPAEPGTPASNAPFAARVTDPTTHGSPLAPGIGSPNVLIGSLPAWRAAVDQHVCPVVKVLVPDGTGTVLLGEPTVLINGMMACRKGDIVVEIPGGPDPILMGCPTVLIGLPTGGGGGGGGGKDDHKGTRFRLVAEGEVDVGTAKGSLGIGGRVNLTDPSKDSAGIQGEGKASLLAGKGFVGLEVPNPFSDTGVIQIGFKGEGDFLTAQGEGTLGVGGASGGVGWGSASGGFTIEAK